MEACVPDGFKTYFVVVVSWPLQWQQRADAGLVEQAAAGLGVQLQRCRAGGAAIGAGAEVIGWLQLHMDPQPT